MTLDPDAISEKLRVLGDRDWPAEFGPDEPDADYLGWCHRYRLEDPISMTEIEEFESTHRIHLDDDYRMFLSKLGNGGAGPGFGIYPLGEEEDGPLPSQILASIAENFALERAWNDTSLLARPEQYYGYELMAGAMPIATLGCALDYWMVASGPQSGQIWLDKRTDNEGVAPVFDQSGQIAQFGTWYQDWLDGEWERRMSG